MKINWLKLDKRMLGKLYFLAFIHFRGFLYIKKGGFAGFAISLIDVSVFAGAYYSWDRNKRVKWLNKVWWLARVLSYQLFVVPLLIVGFVVLIITHKSDYYFSYWLFNLTMQMPAFYALYYFCNKTDLLKVKE